MWEDRRCGENLVENRCGFLLRHAENALKEHQEETAHIDLRQNVTVRCFLIKIHGIHNGLTKAETICFHLRIGIKTAAERRIHKISGCERIVDYASDDLFLFPVKIEVKTCQLLDARTYALPL